MRKITCLLFAFGIFTIVSAQDLKSKQGVPILPEAGEYALGIDAAPLLNYAGNLFNNTINNNTNWAFVNGTQTIMGKYFISNTQAYRGAIRIGYGTWSSTNMVTDNTDATKTVEDKATNNFMNITLLAGKEYRRGKGRLQGFYGAEGMIMINSGSGKYTYGNEMTATNASPTSTSWNLPNMNNPMVTGTGALSPRTTKISNGLGFGIGARAFVGVEYFFLPKVSVGGEFGWGLAFTANGKTKTTTEMISAGNLEETTTEGNKTSCLTLDTDNFGGVMKIMFHF